MRKGMRKHGRVRMVSFLATSINHFIFFLNDEGVHLPQDIFPIHVFGVTSDIFGSVYISTRVGSSNTLLDPRIT
jgi:hypothetical protein